MAVQVTSIVAALISILTAVAVAIYFGADRSAHIEAAPDEAIEADAPGHRNPVRFGAINWEQAQ
jgi:ABC-type proline/glycine betaine transport system substrate-binding protein